MWQTIQQFLPIIVIIGAMVANVVVRTAQKSALEKKKREALAQVRAQIDDLVRQGRFAEANALARRAGLPPPVREEPAMAGSMPSRETPAAGTSSVSDELQQRVLARMGVPPSARPAATTTPLAGSGDPATQAHPLIARLREIQAKAEAAAAQRGGTSSGGGLLGPGGASPNPSNPFEPTAFARTPESARSSAPKPKPSPKQRQKQRPQSARPPGPPPQPKPPAPKHAGHAVPQAPRHDHSARGGDAALALGSIMHSEPMRALPSDLARAFVLGELLQPPASLGPRITTGTGSEDRDRVA